ncbi:hypothetical protein HYC85_027686 [Camellia sinensis]|uniref:Uncharacterized protein n=1 Tax=Camellia sinensis TaxID=4442 RepID=A0A7J7FT33_CAMSI|nr:hypothetical protein HYC85_027686 [Camellia sinensis]
MVGSQESCQKETTRNPPAARGGPGPVRPGLEPNLGLGLGRHFENRPCLSAQPIGPLKA